MNRLEACLLLQSIPGMGMHRCVKIVSHFGSPEAVFEASFREWIKVEGLGERIALELKHWKSYQGKIQSMLKTLDQLEIKALFFGLSDYPQPLSFCSDAPLVLYYKGKIKFENRKIISIVGTRQNSPQGKAFCESLIEAVKHFNPIICSGLAKGIDIIAHRQALRHGLDTVACVAHGLERIYPLEHTAFAKELCKQGAVVTDFLPNAPFRRENFPQRNRLIAGMAHATIVVESGVSGGSMNTADLAHRYGRELFAVPGRPSDFKSSGCHQLIVQQKAQLLSDPSQLVDALGWKISATPKKGVQKALFQTLDAEEQKIYSILSKRVKIPLDEIALELGWKVSETASRLIQLEMKGVVRALPGKQFEWI
jgi:DNA processing protein